MKWRPLMGRSTTRFGSISWERLDSATGAGPPLPAPRPTRSPRRPGLDVSEEWTSIARRYWREAGVAHKIDLRLKPAVETLDALLAEGRRALSPLSTGTRPTT